jgi:glycosyltransferase involved in cell wall biosynthesis
MIIRAGKRLGARTKVARKIGMKSHRPVKAAPAPSPRKEAHPRLLSIVCPAYNEEAVLAEFHGAVRRAMASLDQPFEVIFVNDGSADATLSMMKEIRARHPNTTIIDLSRNFGKEIAITAGLDHARGDAVVLIDADLQHPPEVIADMLCAWRDGYDVVFGARKTRDDESPLKRVMARSFYKVMGRIGRAPLPENAGDFRLMSRKAVDAVISLREQHRFMKGVFAWVGFATKAIPYEVAPRAAGISKFNLWKLWNFSIEGVTSHTLAPLKVSTYLGLFVAFVSIVYGVYFVAKTMLFGDPVPGFPTLVTLMLFLGGVQLIVLGVMGEYLGRVFNETKGRPLYFASEVDSADLSSFGIEDDALSRTGKAAIIRRIA